MNIYRLSHALGAEVMGIDLGKSIDGQIFAKFVARLIAQGIAGSLRQSVIVENRPTGVVPADIVSKAPPDGYTLLLSGSNFWIGPLLQKVPFDPVNDVSPITAMDRSPLVLSAHPSVPVKTIQELTVLAKARPGTINYSSSATGGPTHLAAELFKSMAGVNIVHIRYKGTGPAATALLGDEVQLLFAAPIAVTPHVKSGKLAALAVTAAEPSTLAPGFPTIAVACVPGYEMVGTTGIFAPARTPAPVIKRLNQDEEMLDCLYLVTIRGALCRYRILLDRCYRWAWRFWR